MSALENLVHRTRGCQLASLRLSDGPAPAARFPAFGRQDPLKQLPSAAEHNDGDLGRAEDTELVCLLEQAVFALEERHAPVAVVRDGRDRDLAATHPCRLRAGLESGWTGSRKLCEQRRVSARAPMELGIARRRGRAGRTCFSGALREASPTKTAVCLPPTRPSGADERTTDPRRPSA